MTDILWLIVLCGLCGGNIVFAADAFRSRYLGYSALYAGLSVLGAAAVAMTVANQFVALLVVGS